MNQAWYQVISIAFGYLSVAIVVLIVLLSARKHVHSTHIPCTQKDCPCFPNGKTVFCR